MKKTILFFIFIFTISLTLFCILAEDISTERTNRLVYGYVLYLSEVSTTPSEIAPGSSGTINLKLENIGSTQLKDIRVELTLPTQIAAYQDTSRKKIESLASAESKSLSFGIIATPSADEGVYKIPLNVKYYNTIGDEKNENMSISVSIGSSPTLIGEFKSSDIYKGNLLGTVKITVINNNIGNVKFLKVQLSDSDAYKIIGSDLDYIGDLDSDDFSEVSFKVSLNYDSDSVDLPLVLSYKDSLNRDYEQKLDIIFNIPTAKEAGIKKSYTGILIVIIALVIIGYIVYRRYSKSRKNNKKAFAFSFNSKI